MNEYDTEPPPREHAEWFMQLPRATRHWIEGLNPEKIKDIDDAIKMKRRVEAGSWMVKWLAITLASFFMGAVWFGEKVQQLLALFSHGTKP